MSIENGLELRRFMEKSLGSHMTSKEGNIFIGIFARLKKEEQDAFAAVLKKSNDSRDVDLEIILKSYEK